MTPTLPDGDDATTSIDHRPSADTVELQQHATALATAVIETLPRWVERRVTDVLTGQGIPITEQTLAACAEAGRRASDETGQAVAELLATDIDDQIGTPLTLLRQAVRYPTEILLAAGAEAADRDTFSRSSFPDDHFDLTPANFADVDPALHEPGIVWGAAKAHVHLTRRRREGNR